MLLLGLLLGLCYVVGGASTAAAADRVAAAVGRGKDAVVVGGGEYNYCC